MGLMAKLFPVAAGSHEYMGSRSYSRIGGSLVNLKNAIGAGILGLLLIATDFARAEDITVSAAISLKDSLEAVRQQHETKTGDHLKFTFASSGQLAAQIKNGAPVDLFISAARKQVDDLNAAGKTDKATATVVATNELVLIVPTDSQSAPKSFDELAGDKVKRIGVGEPRTVPAGDYAQQVLQHLKLTEKVKGRLVYGLNVRQVLQYVERGEVEAGIVYTSDAKESGEKVKVVATADRSWHKPIEYWAVVVTGSKHAAGAKTFLEYLQSEPAQAILKANGFVPTTQPAAVEHRAPAEAAPAK
jgi:molybdate transport system substrate-binding protein